METTLKIEGMTCGNCVKHVQQALMEVEGVESATVSLEENRAVVTHGNEATVEQLMASVEEEGYKATQI
ncbi:MAG: cation transporter [Fimbriimonadaceae bacterium]